MSCAGVSSDMAQTVLQAAQDIKWTGYVVNGSVVLLLLAEKSVKLKLATIAAVGCESKGIVPLQLWVTKSLMFPKRDRTGQPESLPATFRSYGGIRAVATAHIPLPLQLSAFHVCQQPQPVRACCYNFVSSAVRVETGWPCKPQKRQLTQSSTGDSKGIVAMTHAHASCLASVSRSWYQMLDCLCFVCRVREPMIRLYSDT